MRAIARLAATVLVIVCSRAAPASAQAPSAWEVSAGFAQVSDSLDLTTLRGLLGGSAIRLTRWLAVAAEIDATTRTDGDVELRTLAVAAGPRAFARIGPFTEFVQLTAGAARLGSTVFGESSSETRAALQPGGGVDLPIGPRFAVRLQIDRRWISSGGFSSEDQHQLRFAASLVYTPR